MKLRADARRNRDKLVESAKTAFAETGPDVSLDEVARRAGVGIGTLYRHFPSRESLVAAVYEREVRQLAAEADRLLDTKPAGDALHEWMRLSIGYVGSKRMIAAALGPTDSGRSLLSDTAVPLVMNAISLLVTKAIEAGDIRADTTPDDIRRALTGFLYGDSGPGWEANTLRLIDIFMAGLRQS